MGLVIGVVLSRVGLWGFDLSVQMLVQEVSILDLYSLASLHTDEKRVSNLNLEDHSRRQKPPSRISSSSGLMPRPFSFLDLNISDTLL